MQRVQIMCFVPDIMEGTVPKHSSAPVILFLYRLCFTPRKKSSKLFFSIQLGSTGPLSPCHAFVSFCIKRKNMYSYVWVCIWGQSSWRAVAWLACVEFSLYIPAIQMSEHRGEFFFYHTSDYWKYHCWGLSRQHTAPDKQRTMRIFS